MLNLPKYVFINGPVGSGKSTLAELICKTQRSAWRESFAEPIRAMMYAVFFPEQGPINFNLDLRDGEVKKRRMKYLHPDDNKRTALSIRDTMISFSESWMKEEFGSEIFGKLLHDRCTEQSIFYETFVIDDSGFPGEAQYIISQEGAANCSLIRLHRGGCDFGGDSRSHISLPGVQTLDLHNEGQPLDMLSLLQLEFGNL